MGFYRKLPVVVEATQVTLANLHAVADWCEGYVGPCGIYIHTLEGEMSADLDDWVIKGIQGEFYPPCRPDIFEATYELALGEANPTI